MHFQAFRAIIFACNNEKEVRYTCRTSSLLKNVFSSTTLAIETNAADKDVLVKEAIKKIDQAAAKGILHPNNAARKKSALMSKANAAE